MDSELCIGEVVIKHSLGYFMQGKCCTFTFYALGLTSFMSDKSPCVAKVVWSYFLLPE
jgi:hypothetical protein